MTLIAYHGDPAVKEKYQARVERHRIADEIIMGTYGKWENGREDGKGCAVGCTIHSPDHASYELELGVPQILARLEDAIFEGSSIEFSKTWPGRFLAAIPVGADLSDVWRKFAIWLLVDSEHGVIKFAKGENTIAAIRAVADAYERKEADEKEWRRLAAAAAAASDAAAYAASYAADAVAAAAAASAASYAAYAAYAADGAAAATYAAASAASYAAYAAYGANAAAVGGVRREAFERQGEKSLQLLAAAPIALGGVKI